MQQQLSKQLPSLLQVSLHQQQHVNKLHGKVQMERRSIPT
jgi:hypothetical protein